MLAASALSRVFGLERLNPANSTIGGADLCGGVERARHLLSNALHGAGAYAEFAGNLVDAFTCTQLLLDAAASAKG
jgi:hypothetical protein